VALHDLTEIKKVSEELAGAYKKLQSTHLQLLQQEKMASIGQLAAGVAHEINNPIGFIKSNLGTLVKYVERLRSFIEAQGEAVSASATAGITESVGEARKRLKIDYVLEDLPKLIAESSEGTERVRVIVQNLKSFSRVDEAERQRVDLNACLESAITIAWNELKYKATLVRDLGDLPPVACYPQKLNQVFLNLLVNAAHAIENRGEVTVRSWRDGDFACVAVGDTGHGIPEEFRNRIFEPFFTTKEIGKGTGLGLSISYEIVTQHGGTIGVESEPGGGATFTVRLPIGAGDPS
jgi:two-component system NtrC family sensor kinase